MFDVIAAKYTRDPKYPARTHDLSLLLRVVAPELSGGIYDLPKGSNGTLYPFHQETLRNQYVPLDKRKPNVPEGTNTLRQAITRQASMLFGADRFPIIETQNEDARRILTEFIEEAEIEDREREAVILGSPGSVARHIRVLAPPTPPNKPPEPARIYVENYTTPYLTPTFNPWRPDELDEVQEKYRTTGKALRLEGYDIKPEDDAKKYWFQRVWDQNREIWFKPWTDQDEKDAADKQGVFKPQEDPERTVAHNMGFCPWLWTKNLPMGRGIDGSCQFLTALDHAINLDYLESQIAAAVKYTMSPTLVIEKPASGPTVATTPTTGSEVGRANSPSTILIIDAQGKAYYLEISGDGIEKARQVADDLRRAIKEACHGDRVVPREITQGHQGAKTMAMIESPLLGLCDQLRSSYGMTLKKTLKMVLKVIKVRAEKGFSQVMINDQLVDAASVANVTDLKLSFGDYYTDTPQELLSEAQAMDLNLKNGLVSRERAMIKLSNPYNIPDITEELAKVKVDQAEILAREIQLGQALKATAQMPNG